MVHATTSRVRHNIHNLSHQRSFYSTAILRVLSLSWRPLKEIIKELVDNPTFASLDIESIVLPHILSPLELVLAHHFVDHVPFPASRFQLRKNDGT